MLRITSFCLVLVALFFYGSTNAQTVLSAGPRLGVNFSSLVGDDVAADGRTALVYGLTSTFSINEKTGIGFDILYSNEGATADTSDEELKLGYVRLPLTFQLFFRDWQDDFRPKVYFGLVPGFLTQAKVNDTEVEDLYSTFDLAGTLGAGFNYRFTKSEPAIWLNTDLRYQRGFTSVFDDVDTEAFNQGVQFTLGLAFGLN